MMGDRADRRWLMAAIAGMIAFLLAGELYRHVTVAPLALPTLLFELAEELLLVGCAATGALMLQGVRVRAMAVAMAAMLALLLTGELYFGDQPATPGSLLFELVELALLIGCALTLLTWRDSRQRMRV